MASYASPTQVRSVREEWARHNASQALKKTFNRQFKNAGLKHLGLKQDIGQHLDLKKDELPPFEDFFGAHLQLPQHPLPSGTPQVAIVGAGAAGLFTAMLLDYLNQNVSTFNVRYDIFESQSDVGGRLFTYNFKNSKPAGPHDYYDVGAMRFPENPVMARTFALFEYLKMSKVPDPQKTPPSQGNLIPYKMVDGVNEPWYFNDIGATGKYPEIAAAADKCDPFKMNWDADQPIPPEALKDGPDKTIAKAIDPWVKALVDNPVNGWKTLMEIDDMSTAQFLAHPPPPPGGGQPSPPYNYNTIEWLETFNGGTSWYDQAHSETVLEFLDFSYPSTTPVEWWCVEGGVNVIAQNMRGKLADPKAIVYNTRVTAIDTSTANAARVKVNNGADWKGSYVGVFNSTTMGALQQMDLRTTKLNYGKKQAMRSLGYGASAKVGMKFTRPWWITEFNITNGGLGHSDLPIRTTVYPSYNLYDDPTQPAVLLCSYNWAQDAQRISTLISCDTDPVQAMKDEAALKQLVLWDLALLHAGRSGRGGRTYTAEEVYALIAPLCMEFYAHDWYHDANTFGAFAFFRPQQFRSMWPYIIQPTPSFVTIGEHASNHHAWVVGALESAVYGVYHWLGLQTFPGARDAARAMAHWGPPSATNPFGEIPPWAGTPNEQEWRKTFSFLEEQDFRASLAQGMQISES